MISDKLPQIWYGGDYNPDQWPPEVWDEDIRLMKLASFNVPTVPVFSWANLQPDEETFDFGWLDRVMDLLAQNAIHACLATSTAAQPAWMSERYPEILPVDINGVKRKHGGRVNFCPSSPRYRELAAGLAGRLAERYRDHPALLIWHIANEYGTYCYCETCAEAFRDWLKARYGSLERLNERWYTNFWGHRYTSWSQVDTPTTNGERSNQSILIDYNRFQSDASLGCYLAEYRAIKAVTPDVPITTNLMGTFKPLDYFRWAPHLDVISWDNYPGKDAHMGNIAMRHDLMRGLRAGQPFMLMEQTPSQQNWQAQNALKRPGVMRLWSYQAVAHGADTVMFFQWRRSRGACEKYHGAVVAHCGHENTRVFAECAELGAELERLGDALLDSRVNARVAIVFDWENWWAIEFSAGPSVDLHYCAAVEQCYRALWEQNIPVDMVSSEMDLSGYDVVIAPVLYMVKPGVAERIGKFVKAGGTFVTTFFSGVVDENDLVTLGGYPGELREVLGVWAEEIDALLPGETNAMVMAEPMGDLKGAYTCSLLCDLIHAEGAKVLATYRDDFYAGRPCLTVNSCGKGKAYYVASAPSEEFMRGFVRELCKAKGIAPLMATPAGVEVTRREKGNQAFTFVLNHNREASTVALPKQAVDLLTGRRLKGEVEVPAHGVLILRSAK
jgi:beta-galactosidase